MQMKAQEKNIQDTHFQRSQLLQTYTITWEREQLGRSGPVCHLLTPQNILLNHNQF